jgi:nucleotide-binding universal stress UspA family protein
MKHVLVATDLSARSERAVRRAFALAEEHGSALTVLSVIDEDLPQDMAAQLRAASEANLVRFCDSVSQHPRDVRVETGDPQSMIHEVADRTGADLIVLGVHRNRPWADMVSGTTMERLVRGTSRPALLVQDVVDHAYRRAVSGIDFSPSCLAALEAAATLVPQARIDTFHAVHVPFRGFLAPGDTAEQLDPFVTEATARMNAWLDTVDLPANCAPPEVIVASVREALTRMLGEDGADLVVIGAHGRASFAPSYLGSFTESLLRHPPCDILVVRR